MKKKKIYGLLFFFICLVYLIIVFKSILFKYVSPFEIFASERYFTKGLNLIPFSGYKYTSLLLQDILVNFILFVPFGFLISMKTKKQRIDYIYLIAPLLTSILLEIMQYVFSLGITDITDVISNFAGAIWGFLFYRISIVVFKSRNKLDIIYIILMFIVACFSLILML